MLFWGYFDLPWGYFDQFWGYFDIKEAPLYMLWYWYLYQSSPLKFHFSYSLGATLIGFDLDIFISWGYFDRWGYFDIRFLFYFDGLDSFYIPFIHTLIDCLSYIYVTSDKKLNFLLWGYFDRPPKFMTYYWSTLNLIY